ncbi:WD repeat domain-containing protein 83 [Balamuthia mandrillaris]
MPGFPTKEAQTLKGHVGPVNTVKFNSNGNYCLSCGHDKTVRLWNPNTATLIKTYTGHGYEVLDLAVASDNSKIASCGGDRQIFLWDVATGKPIRRFQGHEARVNCIVSSKDDAVLVSGSYDKTVKVWDCKSRSYSPIQVLDHARDSVSAVIVTEEEIITGSVDGCVRTYDIRAGKIKTDSLGQPVTFVSLSNDKNCLLVSTLDSALRLLDKSSGELLAEYKGHKNDDYKISNCFTNTDSHVISGSEDRNIYIWDLVEGEIVAVLKGHTRGVCSVSYAPLTSAAAPPQQLLSASLDGTLKLWG